MRWAMTEEVIPRLTKQFQTKQFLKQVFYTEGISESALAIHLNNFEEALPTNFELAYLPGGGVIRLRLSVKGVEHTKEIEKQAKQLKDLLGNYLLAESDDSLQQILGNQLKESGLTISVAESCTGGYIAHLLTNIAGSSAYFKGGVVSYANSAKMNLLNVNKHTLDTHGAVSKQVVEEMAQGSIEAFGTACAISVSGVAGPDGGTEEKPVGTVWICTICKDKMVSKRYTFGKSRENNKRRSAVMAMVQMLRCME